MNLFRGAATIGRRLAADLFPADRLAEYQATLDSAIANGYHLMSLASFDTRPATDDPARVLVIRHDVDINDVSGNRAFHTIEQRVGATSSFYFRRSTASAHKRLIGDLRATGFEVGYHFEEAATVALRRHLRDRDAVLRHRDEIVDLFRVNCDRFRQRWNPDLVSVASHGDWLNRRLGVANHELLSDDVLSECGIRFEAYGARVLGRADVYISDVASPPARWAAGYGLDQAVRSERTPIYLLTHERRWHAAPIAAIRADVERVAATLRYVAG